jgi:hypothetical protein
MSILKIAVLASFETAKDFCGNEIYKAHFFAVGHVFDDVFNSGNVDKEYIRTSLLKKGILAFFPNDCPFLT